MLLFFPWSFSVGSVLLFVLLLIHLNLFHDLCVDLVEVVFDVSLVESILLIGKVLIYKFYPKIVR